MEKKFYRDKASIKPVAVGYGSCVATDRIMVDGMPVGRMHREEPKDQIDSGWTFMAGDESQEYVDDPANWGIYDVNTIANYDPSITSLLESEPGYEFSRSGLSFIRSKLEIPED